MNQEQQYGEMFSAIMAALSEADHKDDATAVLDIVSNGLQAMYNLGKHHQKAADDERQGENAADIERRYIAAMLTAGMLANPERLKVYDNTLAILKEHGVKREFEEIVATDAVGFADALLKELSEPSSR